jgi:uncharacterized protein YndB with AHSA1/START domain/catechol 2,3-dioxygenase-like lactoylglutathione lyase family enzyme
MSSDLMTDLTDLTTGDAIIIEMTYPHPIERVWRALTSADALAAWLMPNDFVPQVGHRFTFHSQPQFDWNGVVFCEVTQLDAPHVVAFTWQGGGLPVTLLTFTLRERGTGTHLRLEHSGFAAGGPPALTVRDILRSGWGSKLLRKQFPDYLDQLAREDAAETSTPTEATKKEGRNMQYRVGLVRQLVRDLAQARAFYVDVLGMEVIPEFTNESDFIFLKPAAGTPIALQKVEDTEGSAQPVGGSEINLGVEDVDAAWNDLKARGVEVGEIVDVGAGRAFFFTDPEGHALGIMQMYPEVEATRRERGIQP